VLGSVLAFTLAALLLTITPGLDTMLVMRTSVRSGSRAGLVAGAGITLGVFAWGAATAFGLSALLLASRLAFDVLRIIGAVYLTTVGVRMLWRARRGTGAQTEESKPRATPASAGEAFRTGALTNLLNPKVGVFYITLLPAFIPHGAPMLTTSLLLASIHATLGMAWFTLIALLVGRVRRLLDRPRVQRRVEQLTGIAFIGFGTRLALTLRHT
jgi:threonine/homoserine/homoserine lactone efflux protein